MIIKMELQRIGVLSSAVALAFLIEDEDALVMNGMRRTHRYWMSPYLRDRNNPYQRNTLAKLEMDFIRLGSVDEFRATLRMPPDVYQQLVTMVTPVIQRQHTNFRMCISPEERLSLTLRYLAFGDSTRTLHQAYLVGYSTVQPLIRDTCQALYGVLHTDYLPTPTTNQEWETIAAGFSERWNMPYVLGAVDGKHVRIRCPRNSGSLYYNYKNYFSMVMLVVVDYDYRFIFVDVGAEGHASDSRIWRESQFFQDVDNPENPLNIPDPSLVNGMQGRLPYYFVGDDAFALGIHLMKPFPAAHLTYEQRIYNYRLSRCRRIVENGFGILASRFRIFMREQDMEPAGVQVVIKAAVALHNFLRTKAGTTYTPRGSTDFEDREHNVVEGLWRRDDQLDPVIGHQHVRNRSLYVKNMRKSLANWCMSRAGEVRWQYSIVPAGGDE